MKWQICITTSTSAGLEQILPWMFYHRVLGVTNFFLFVEGHAASPNVSKVLESLPVSLQSLWPPLNWFFSVFFSYIRTIPLDLAVVIVGLNCL